MFLATISAQPFDNAASLNAWSWDHARAHGQLMAVMGPLTQWSQMPYFIDPQDFNARPAAIWNLQHQAAHTDFTSALPAYSTATRPGIASIMPLMDTNYQRKDALDFPTFANYWEHMIAANAILPLNEQQTPLPWWLQPPHRVQTYW